LTIINLLSLDGNLFANTANRQTIWDLGFGILD
jgi:hypothetical protein